MIGITVLGILLGLAVPTFRQFSLNNSVTAAQNDLVTSFNLARSEALRRNRPVSVCASKDSETCGDETEWSSGWLAFTDRGVLGNVDGDDVILQAWQSSNTNLVFDSSGNTYVRYLPTGLADAAVTFNVSYTGCVGPYLRRVDIMATGAVSGHTDKCP